MNFIRLPIVAAGLAGAFAVSAMAETVTVNIAADAPYDQSLICYQFHGIAAQVMKAASESADVPQEDKQGLAVMSQFAGYMQQHWHQHIDAVKGERTLEQVNADLKSKTAHVIADAEASLNGDKEAQARQQAIEKACVGYEGRKVVEDAK